jgi:hypothetical protein
LAGVIDMKGTQRCGGLKGLAAKLLAAAHDHKGGGGIGRVTSGGGGKRWKILVAPKSQGRAQN